MTIPTTIAMTVSEATEAFADLDLMINRHF